VQGGRPRERSDGPAEERSDDWPGRPGWQEKAGGKANGRGVRVFSGGFRRFEPPVMVGRMNTVDFIVGLQRKFTDAVGFLPRAAVEEFVAAGRFVVAQENDEDVGAVLWRPRLRCMPECASIVQAMVFLDAQRREHGRRLVDAVCSEAAVEGRLMVGCWCAADLAAVEFWESAGFRPVGLRPGGARRSRALILFRRSLLPGGGLPRRFFELPARAGWKARRVDRADYGPGSRSQGQE
jgi:L-amino acid N-acyltransferase YncA